MKPYRYFDLIMAVFVTVLVLSSIAASPKIVDLGFNLFHEPMAFDSGAILFLVNYMVDDSLTEVYGYKKSLRVIWTGFACLALSAVIFWTVGILPGESTWQGYAGGAAYNAILGGMSTGGIVLASLVGYWTGEFTNLFTLAKRKVLTNGRWLWTRTIGSTLIGELVDTVVFGVVASVFGIFPWSLFLTMNVTNYLFKWRVEALMTPFTYKVVGFLKKAENEDYYDKEMNFNLFAV